jgi:hypothetical protein
MAKRAGIWAVGGAAAATVALVASPGTYGWLRKRAGLQDEPREYFETPDESPADEMPVDTREARLSLRARLAEAQERDDEAEPAAAHSHHRRPERGDHEPMRRAVDEARGRMRAKARAATGGDADSGDADGMA